MYLIQLKATITGGFSFYASPVLKSIIYSNPASCYLQKDIKKAISQPYRRQDRR